jgi:hypothetical protein
MAGHKLGPDALRDEIIKLADEPSKLYDCGSESAFRS